MIKIVSYRCEYCDKRFNTVEDCEKHEEWCQKDKLDRMRYLRRLYTLSENHQLFYAHSEEDLERCGDVIFDTYLYPPKEANYPCLMLIIERLQYSPYDNDYSSSYTVQPFSEFSRQIDSLVKEIKIQEVENATINPKRIKQNSK